MKHDSNSPDRYIGQSLKHYTILSKLGAGGMGDVYLAEDTRLKRKAALKILPQRLALDDVWLRRFQNEARAISTLNHPNIVTIYGVEQAGETHFLATEFVDGKTLREELASGALSPKTVLGIATQAASALAAAHSAGIVHRDIKPENIMVRRDGLVKVLDFGVAKMVEGVVAGDADSLTRTGTVVGTPTYMSPEQARGQDVDARSDLFSLGSVLYEMLAGRKAFQGDNAADVLTAILTAEPPPLESQLGLDKVVRKCLEKNRDARYSSGKELENQLRELQAPRLKSPSRGRQFALAALVLLVAAAALWYAVDRNRLRAMDSILVLPFVNGSGDQSVEYLSDGLTEELINSLSRETELKVMGRPTAFAYKSKQESPQKIGRELGVQVIVTGKLTQRAGRLTVQVDLLAATDGAQLWGRQYNRPADEMQTMEDEIARQILARIRLKPESKVAKRRAVNPQAYDLHLKGRNALSVLTESGVRKAAEYFEQAVVLDPEYAAAYAGLADAYSYLGFFEVIPPAEVLRKAKPAALRALALDPQSADAYVALGGVQLNSEWNWKESERSFLKAVELSPRNGYVRHWYAHWLEASGQWERALQEMQAALEPDPLNGMIGEDLAADLYYNARIDDMIAQARKVIRVANEEPIVHLFHAYGLEIKGMRAESVAELDAVQKFSPAGWLQAASAAAYARLGKPERARTILQQLRERASQSYVAPLALMVVHLAVGDKEKAFEYLQRTCQERSVNLPMALWDPAFDPIRADPRFIRMLDQAGVPRQAYARMSPATR
ncbi:MAG: protein kinase [Candidatus Solibacter usitatus]|nr:protein kinase [Candidatus Solibacter usitatus]